MSDSASTSKVPTPRSGLIGAWDQLIGPGATRAEESLIIVAALAGALLAPLYAYWAGLNWSPLQYFVAGLIAADLAGGVATNATSAAKRWYHRPGQGPRQHLGFIALHALHPLLVAWLFRSGDWGYFLGVYAYLMLASTAIVATPLYLRRPVGLLLYTGGVLLSLYAWSPTPGLEWFLPVFYLKLLVSHLLPERAYLSTES